MTISVTVHPDHSAHERRIYRPRVHTHYNNDVMRVVYDRHTKQYTLSREERAFFVGVIEELQEVMAAEPGMGSSPPGLLRFIIPLAMRFAEQAGRRSFREPEDNNPYNIMGTGGTTKERQEVDSALTQAERSRAATAGTKPDLGNTYKMEKSTMHRFPTIRDGVKAYFAALRTAHDGAWSPAWRAIRDVTSIEEFARGLRPRGKPHYLTEHLSVHISGLRHRARGALNLLELILIADLAWAEAEDSSDQILFPALLGDPHLGPEVRKRMAMNRTLIPHCYELLDAIERTRTHLHL